MILYYLLAALYVLLSVAVLRWMWRRSTAPAKMTQASGIDLEAISPFDNAERREMHLWRTIRYLNSLPEDEAERFERERERREVAGAAFQTKGDTP